MDSRVPVSIGMIVGMAMGALAACSDDAPRASAADAGVDAAVAAVDASAEASSCPLERRAELRGRVTILDGSKDPPPAAGARVCVHGRPDLPCASALADGTFEHTCMPEGDAAVLFEQAGIGRTLWLRVFTSGLGQTIDAKIATTEENRKLFAPAGVTYPRAGHGMITVNDSQDSAGGGIRIEPHGAGVEGPFLSGNGETIDADGGLTHGGGVAFLVAPVGEQVIGLSDPDGGACGQVSGGWGTGGGTITVPVLEDTETNMLVRCP